MDKKLSILIYFAIVCRWSGHRQASVLLSQGGGRSCVDGGGRGGCGVDGGRRRHRAVGRADGHTARVVGDILKCDRGRLQRFRGHGRKGRRVDRSWIGEFSRFLKKRFNLYFLLYF